MKDDEENIRIIATLLKEKEHIELWISDDPQLHFGYEARIFMMIFDLEDDFVLKSEGNFSQWTATGEELADYAQAYAGAYDLAIQVCACHLHRDLPLPKPLRIFATDVLTKEISRPKKVWGKSREKYFMRNVIFINYMEMLTGPYFGYPAARNPASKSLCAADILALALNECGYAMVTWNTVMNVWKDQTFRDELNALRRR